MAYHDTTLESELLEHFCCLSVSRDESVIENELHDSDISPGLLYLSDEVLIVILNHLEPVSLLRLGSTCYRLFRVCSCDSLWTRHFRDSFGVGLPNITTTGYATKTAFRLVFMWRALFRNVHCNRSLQEKLFAEVPFPPHAYWTQWLVMEERVPLPAAQLPCADVEKLWGMPRELFTEKLQEKPEGDETLRMEWRELYNLAVTHHGSTAMLFHYVLKRHQSSDHSELESMYRQYTQCRFQWLFTYWLFRQPAPLNRQLRAIYLQWRKHSKKKVSTWGETVCDVRYLASLHPITSDYWRGKLARGDENIGIHTVGNYFSMCKSLVAWILGRDWGRLKRRKVYEDTLDGVYLLLKREMQQRLVEHERFWQVAKVQMSRVCTLEETAVNYVNWRMIEMLPYYKLYLVSGNGVYLQHVQGFLRRKTMLHDWIYLEDNTWLRELLPDELFTLLEFDTKISQGSTSKKFRVQNDSKLQLSEMAALITLVFIYPVKFCLSIDDRSLHGASANAQLSRLIWLYLHSGEQLYMEGVKQTVLQYVHARLAFSTHGLSADLWQPVLRPVSP